MAARVQMVGTSVGAVILAAGGGHRFGQIKQLLPLGGKPLLARVLDAVLASPVQQVVLVLGAHASTIRQQLAGYAAQPRLLIVDNPAWQQGLSTSLRAGLAALGLDVAAVLMVLGDQPHVSPELIARLLRRWQQTGARLVAPAYKGSWGNPVLFARSLFPELRAVTGDRGGRDVVRRHADELALVEVDAALCFDDIDTPADYVRALQLFQGEGALSREKRLSDIRHLLIDMDGVMYRGMTAIPGAREFLDFCRERGIPFLLFTNNSSLTPQEYVTKLAGMDIHVAPQEVFTSSAATAMHLGKVIPPGSRVYVIGESGVREALRAAGYEVADGHEGVAAVVVGWDRHLTYRKLKEATLAIRAGAAFIGTNPDKTYPAEEGLVPGNGAILAAIEAATDVSPFIVGKPELPIFQVALDRLDADAAHTAIIGDRPETDILGGQRAGLMTILVLTGVVGERELAASGLAPDWVFADLPALQNAWVAELG